MEKKKIKLAKGEILIYDFGTIKVHNYNTKDALNDQVILLEKNKKMIIMESPTFYDNNKELEEYLKSLKVEIEGILLAYHMGGGHFLENVNKYATHDADHYGHQGGGKALIDGFTQTFGESFDSKIHDITTYIEKGELTLADIKLNIIPTQETYDIEIPEINCIYTHMLGSDCHSILGGIAPAQAWIKTLKGYLEKNYHLIFTSHYVPEDITAVEKKISYVETLLEIASSAHSASEMIQKVEEKYKEYSGKNYLEMTANFFFPEK